MKRAALLSALLAIAGCSDPVEPVEQKAPPPPTQAAVVTFATFARVIDGATAVAEGLNVDGLVSTNGDTESCGMKDFTSPDGESGIDNQFGGLLPTIESYVGAENIGALLAAAIANGQLLILLAVEGLDDPVNDPEVTLRISAGLGTPLLDSKGTFITYQTFGVDRDTAPVSEIPAKVEDGKLIVGPGKAILPVRVLDARFTLDLYGVVGRLDLVPDEIGGGFAIDGILAGGLRVDDFKGIITSLNIGDDVMGAATGLIGLLADLAPDPETGKCTQVSAGLRVQATPAYILDE